MIFLALIGLLLFVVGRVLAQAYAGPWGDANAFWSWVALIGFVVMVSNLLRFAWSYLP